MNAETRAALEWAIASDEQVQRVGYPISGGSKHRAALQRLLDEKGGVPSDGAGSNVAITPTVSSPSTPPDSPAKIAADLEPLARKLESDYPTHRPIARAMRAIAARVEALGLEPGERDTVREVLRDIRSLYWTKRHFGFVSIEATIDRKQADRWIAALAPIAEPKP